jgi:hypothetical protein
MALSPTALTHGPEKLIDGEFLEGYCCFCVMSGPRRETGEVTCFDS